MLTTGDVPRCARKRWSRYHLLLTAGDVPGCKQDLVEAKSAQPNHFRPFPSPPPLPTPQDDSTGSTQTQVPGARPKTNRDPQAPGGRPSRWTTQSKPRPPGALPHPSHARTPRSHVSRAGGTLLTPICFLCVQEVITYRLEKDPLRLNPRLTHGRGFLLTQPLGRLRSDSGSGTGLTQLRR